jgi:phosphate butyryltransferase
VTLSRVNSFADVMAEAGKKGPVRMAFLAPEDGEFMRALKVAWERGLVDPILVGRPDKVRAAATEAGLDIKAFARIDLDDLQAVADYGVDLLFKGKADVVSKGQMSTNYVYRAVIRKEKKEGDGRVVAVLAFWEIAPLGCFVILTDPGANITPDRETKAALVRNAAAYLRLFGHDEPRALILSARRETDDNPLSHSDAVFIKDTLEREGFLVQSGSFSHLFTAPAQQRPNILLVPHLVTGNSVVKLDFGLDVKRYTLIMTSRGPVLVPSRSDTWPHLVGEIALSAVVATRLKEVSP